MTYGQAVGVDLSTVYLHIPAAVTARMGIHPAVRIVATPRTGVVLAAFLIVNNQSVQREHVHNNYDYG